MVRAGGSLPAEDSDVRILRRAPRALLQLVILTREAPKDLTVPLIGWGRSHGKL